MSRLRVIFVPLVTVLVCLASARAAEAQFNRVFASARSGNDANSCNNINTPCQTLQGAVNQVAAGGSVIVLDSGGYGRVTITKSLKIEAPPGIVAFIHPPSFNAITVNAGATDSVVLRGLVLNVGDSSDGIGVFSVGELHVESCVIDGFRDGVSFATSGKLFVLDTIVRNSSVGINLRPSSGTAVAAIERCRLDKNMFGLEVGAFSPAIVKASIKDSLASGQFASGLRADAFSGGTAELNVENCLVTNNGSGIFSFGRDGGVAVVRVSNTTVTDNTGPGVSTFGGQILSRGNNTVEGNSPDGSFSGTFAAK